VVSAVPYAIASAGGILVVKGVLLYFALAQVDWTREDITWLTRTAAWIVSVALFCALINLVLPAQWTAVFANTGQAQYRSFLPSLIGPFTHPLQFGNFMSLVAIACATPLLYRARTQPRATGTTALFLASALSAVLSFRRTAVVGMLAGLSYLALRRRHASLLVTALLVLPVAGVVLYPVVRDVAEATYQNFIVDAAENARTRMTVDSVALAIQHFPFGVGFGRFGSAIARDFYSIEYFRLGYDAVNGLGSPGNPNNHGRWLTDTQWPAILGETGIVGAAFFVAGLWRIVATFRKASHAAFLPLRQHPHVERRLPRLRHAPHVGHALRPRRHHLRDPRRLALRAGRRGGTSRRRARPRGSGPARSRPARAGGASPAGARARRGAGPGRRTGAAGARPAMTVRAPGVRGPVRSRTSCGVSGMPALR
jgi:hypothetical protein